MASAKSNNAGVLKNVLTFVGIVLILLNFEGALISPRKALNKFYGIRHEKFDSSALDATVVLRANRVRVCHAPFENVFIERPI